MTDLGTARPHAASYIIFRKEEKIALLLRENVTWMSGHYGLPAGKVENGEFFTACAVRESKEEVGVDVKPEDLNVVLVMHRNSSDDMSWVDVFFEAVNWGGQLQNAEPDVHSELAWYSLDELPENTIPNVRFALEQIRDGKRYCEYDWV